MDGVLVDSEPFHVQAFKILMDELKLDYDDSFVHSFIGHSIKSNIQLINEKFMQGRELNLEEAVEYRDKLYINLIKQADLQSLPGIDALIKLCTERGIILALASSSTKEQVDVILDKFSANSRNLRQIFQTIITGDDVKARKPAPEIYNRTVKNINVDKQFCLAVEDSPAGVQSAKSAGLKCIALKSIFIPQSQLQSADILVDRIDEITAIINLR